MLRRLGSKRLAKRAEGQVGEIIESACGRETHGLWVSGCKHHGNAWQAARVRVEVQSGDDARVLQQAHLRLLRFELRAADPERRPKNCLRAAKLIALIVRCNYSSYYFACFRRPGQ